MAQNPAMMDKWQDAIYQSGKVAQVPHVSWWQIGGLPLAMTETPIGEHCHVLIEHTGLRSGRVYFNLETYL